MYNKAIISWVALASGRLFMYTFHIRKSILHPWSFLSSQPSPFSPVFKLVWCFIHNHKCVANCYVNICATLCSWSHVCRPVVLAILYIYITLFIILAVCSSLSTGWICRTKIWQPYMCLCICPLSCLRFWQCEAGFLYNNKCPFMSKFSSTNAMSTFEEKICHRWQFASLLWLTLLLRYSLRAMLGLRW